VFEEGGGMENSNEFGGEQILLVDDNPINLQILYKTLQGSGYRLLVAKNGETALEIAERVRPSLVLLDIMMPGLDGFEVCRRLKQNPVTVDVAVIFLSALDDSVAKVRGFAVGGVDYIAKPFQADEVVARVRTHVKIHRLELQLARRNSELEEENQQILNAVDEGIVGLDGDGGITVFNPAAAVISGWSGADVIGGRVHTLGLFQGDRAGNMPEEQTPAYRAYRLGETVHSDLEWIVRRARKVAR
jgi:two-component system, LuxR family, sensor kinase FixL